MKLLVILNLLFTLLLSASGQKLNEEYQNLSVAIVKKALNDRKGYQLLKELCDIGPRLSGYPGSYKAIDWCAEQLDSLGCNRIWLHSVMVPRWIRGKTEEAFFRGIVVDI